MTALLAICAGIALELGIQAVSGRREAWDSAQYWTIGLPVAGFVSFALGWCARRRDWLWAFAIVPAQVLTMMARSGELGNLWPLALSLSLVLSTPFVALSFLGSRFRPSRTH
jgi:hypothetical protein